jgi:two-component system cell cycle response regulator
LIDNIDKLTGLYIQKYFLKRLDEELARTNRYKRPLTLILFEINYSHFMPDYNIRWSMVYTLLKQFGALLLRQLRNVDIAGRYGGEMFSILLPETPIEGGRIAAERIRQKVENHKFIGDNVVEEVRLALNGGIATSPIHGKTSREIISSSHQGLLMARNEGGNRIVVCPHILYDETGKSLLTIEPGAPASPAPTPRSPATDTPTPQSPAPEEK